MPWHHAAVSGFITDPDRKKMSKSKGNVVTPASRSSTSSRRRRGALLGGFCPRLGVDTALDEKVFKVGKRLVTKLFNAGKFALSQEAEVGPVVHELDRAFLARLRTLVERSGQHFERFEHAPVLQEVEGFFWSHFTDSFLELVKLRARAEGAEAAAGRASAVAALRLGLDVQLRLLAPFLPYVTEEVWSWAFAEERALPSIHGAPWPDASDFEGIAAPDDAESFELAVACWTAINKAKSEASVSVGREVARMTLAANAKTQARLEPGLADVLDAARCQQHELAVDDALEDGVFAVRDAEFVER